MVIVTALYYQDDNVLTHSLETYLQSLNYILSLGYSTVLFLDPQIPIEFVPNNVILIRMPLSDLACYDVLNKLNVNVCQGKGVNYNPSKNTLKYHIIMNSKVEFLYRASLLIDDDFYCWIDAGICRVLEHVCILDTKLKLIDKLQPGIIIPGCWENKGIVMDDVNWRFCGGVVVIYKDFVEKFNLESINVIKKLLPLVVWEVNIWAYIEVFLDLPILWYKADHNDTIFNFDEYLLNV